jgi:hypothetical protein
MDATAITMSAHPAASPRPGAASARLRLAQRAGAAAAAAVCLAVLLIAAWLDPSPSGHGTHTQIGPLMAPCAWPYLFGVPCPTCGMTTAFAHAADGHLAASFAAQPFGCLLAVGTAAGVWAGAFAAVTGSPVGRFLAIMLRPRVLWVLVVLAAGAWGYKLATWPGL